MHAHASFSTADMLAYAALHSVTSGSCSHTLSIESSHFDIAALFTLWHFHRHTLERAKFYLMLSAFRDNTLSTAYTIFFFYVEQHSDELAIGAADSVGP